MVKSSICPCSLSSGSFVRCRPSFRHGTANPLRETAYTPPTTRVRVGDWARTVARGNASYLPSCKILPIQTAGYPPHCSITAALSDRKMNRSTLIKLELPISAFTFPYALIFLFATTCCFPLSFLSRRKSVDFERSRRFKLNHSIFCVVSPSNSKNFN